MVLSASGVCAQSGPASRTHGAIHGYGFVAPGQWSTTVCERFETNSLQCAHESWSDPETVLHLGGGVEWPVLARTSLTAEAGALVAEEALGAMVSANALVRARRAASGRTLTWSPFLTAGYSLDSDNTQGVNAGGGIDWAPRPATTLRVELRAHFWDSHRFVEVRAGVNFTRRH